MLPPPSGQAVAGRTNERVPASPKVRPTGSLADSLSGSRTTTGQLPSKTCSSGARAWSLFVSLLSQPTATMVRRPRRPSRNGVVRRNKEKSCVSHSGAAAAGSQNLCSALGRRHARNALSNGSGPMLRAMASDTPAMAAKRPTPVVLSSGLAAVAGPRRGRCRTALVQERGGGGNSTCGLCLALTEFCSMSLRPGLPGSRHDRRASHQAL
mmetsp:Transcript_4106/g.17228  ORF Transcript_4106/g.17228 Transcript_4106/m.17228 type:complete len:210 (+) Transcript_4106:1515-2144(+)